VALSRSGYALAYVVGDLDRGAALIDRALVLAPNLAEAWHYSGWVRVWLGEPDTAVKHFAQAMRLNPLDPLFHAMQSGTAFAHFLCRPILRRVIMGRSFTTGATRRPTPSSGVTHGCGRRRARRAARGSAEGHGTFALNRS
jgi:tetratricopeptide (TPR) repeat protein